MSSMPDNASANPQAKSNLGELLVRERLITRTQLEEALAVQEREREQDLYNLGKAILKRNSVPFKEISRIAKTIGFEDSLLHRLRDEQRLDQKEYERMRKVKGRTLLDQLVDRRIVSQEELIVRYDLPKAMEEALKKGLISNEIRAAVGVAGNNSARMLGEILVAMGHVNVAALNYVIEKYDKRRRLGDLLVQIGYISQDRFMESLRERGRSPVPIGEYLTQKGMVTDEELLNALAKQFNIPAVDLEELQLEKDDLRTLRNLMTPVYAKQHRVLPAGLQGQQLTIALYDPRVLKEEVNADYGGYNVRYVLMSNFHFRDLFKHLYDHELEPERVSGKMVDVEFLDVDLEEKVPDAVLAATYTKEAFQDIKAHELVNRIVKHGVEIGASDIHIEQDYDGVKLRYRVDGVLSSAMDTRLTDSLREHIHAVVSRIKIISNMDIAEKRLPQDGAFRMSYMDKKSTEKVLLDFRVATCRATVAENVVIRILDSRKSGVRLDDLNISPSILSDLRKSLQHPAGMLLVTGPTRSGKTTTLYAALQDIYNPGLKIITAEDPVEYNFPGIMQTQVHPKIGLNFPRLLRSFLRLDPDVILVGEIRDAETAQIAFTAAQTGHLLLSTLHTNDSFSSLVRLKDLGLDYGEIAASLKGVLAQRLVRFVCPYCKEEYQPDEEIWSQVFLQYPKGFRFHRGAGCLWCRFSGYLGRGCVSEMFIVDRKMQALITRGTELDVIREAAVDRGMTAMVQDAVRHLDKTNLAEILRVIPHDMIQTFKEEQEKKGPEIVEMLLPSIAP
ncbi:MAG: Flp pilus assembly complex ATPase component TadA [Deltaproteobacteria bacterium]|nr:Flp pilus assembly complex ATPase component TadA [Deltaproteobacteria bacterium]